MPSSVIVAVRQAVRDGLLELTAEGQPLAEVEVTYNWKQDSHTREQIFTMRPSGDHQPAGMRSGRNHRDEDGEFTIVVHVELVGGNAEDGDLRAIELGQVVEEFIADRKNNELEVEGLQSIQITGWQMSGGPADQAYISQLLYTVKYRARLT